jgi:hypothetical protein
MSYEQKYLKYKQKYLALKNKLALNLQGGGKSDDILDIDSLTDTPVNNQKGGVAPFGHMSLHAKKDIHANVDGMVAPALTNSLYGKPDFSNTHLSMKAPPFEHASISKNIKMKVPIVTGPEPNAAEMNETAGPIADVKPYSSDDPLNNDTSGKLEADPDYAPPEAHEPVSGPQADIDTNPKRTVAPEPTPIEEVTTLTESEKKPETVDTQKNIADTKLKEATGGETAVVKESTDADLGVDTPVSETSTDVPVSAEAKSPEAVVDSPEAVVNSPEAVPQTGGDYDLSSEFTDSDDNTSVSDVSSVSDDSLSSISSVSDDN